MNRVVAVIAVLLLALATTLVIVSSYDFVPTHEWKEGSAEAERDSWLAFSRGQGLDTHRYDSVEDIDLSRPGLVIADWSDLQDDEPQRWADWVESGGRLLLMFSPRDHWKGDWAEHSLFQGMGEMATDNHGGTTAKMGSLVIDVDPYVRMSPVTGALSYADDSGVVFAVRSAGEGWVSSSGQLMALYNKGLSKPDNRLFAASLVRDLKGPVWLPEPESGPPVPEPGLGSPVLALSLALFAGLLFWRASSRLGPVLQAERFERRGLADRLIAEGRFLRRYKLLPKTKPNKEVR
jgi:hypothetical protein